MNDASASGRESAAECLVFRLKRLGCFFRSLASGRFPNCYQPILTIAVLNSRFLQAFSGCPQLFSAGSGAVFVDAVRGLSHECHGRSVE